eukprot:scaffold93708_cov72-Phaeocystis_antarctica.AAC.3
MAARASDGCCATAASAAASSSRTVASSRPRLSSSVALEMRLTAQLHHDSSEGAKLLCSMWCCTWLYSVCSSLSIRADPGQPWSALARSQALPTQARVTIQAQALTSQPRPLPPGVRQPTRAASLPWAPSRCCCCRHLCARREQAP